MRNKRKCISVEETCEGMRGNVGFLCPVDQREKERENSIHLVKLLTILKMLNAVIYIYIYVQSLLNYYKSTFV